MKEAIILAKKSFEMNEVPVGAVVVKKGSKEIIGRGYNQMILTKDPTAHAEIVAIREACLNIGKHRLDECEIYTTLEPCIMCIGAIAHARIEKLYYGAKDLKYGAISKGIIIHHKVEVYEGLMEEESGELLKEFFRKLRDSKL